jgi:hypothetical protein
MFVYTRTLRRKDNLSSLKILLRHINRDVPREPSSPTKIPWALKLRGRAKPTDHPPPYPFSCSGYSRYNLDAMTPREGSIVIPWQLLYSFGLYCSFQCIRLCFFGSTHQKFAPQVLRFKPEFVLLLSSLNCPTPAHVTLLQVVLLCSSPCYFHSNIHCNKG